MKYSLIDHIKRIIFRHDKELKAYALRNNRVCMVVWNTFETDARVMKEAVTLTKSGKKVTVIAVHEPTRTKMSEVINGISIIRVSRSLRKGKEMQRRSQTRSGVSVGDNVQKEKNTQRFTFKKGLKKTIGSLRPQIRRCLRWVPKALINIRFFSQAYKQNAGIYHAHDLNTLVTVYLVSRLRGAPLIYDAHEVSTDRAGWKNKWLWETIERLLIRKADQVITTNQTRAEYFASQYNIDLPWIIRNVPPYQEINTSNRIREECHIENDDPIILYQGGLQRERGLENIIECVSMVPKGTFVFIGNGQLRHSLVKMVQNKQLENRVKFLGAVANEELLSYTASATIGLQLLQNTCFNHYSACSNKLHEYLMAGLPVIASDLPEMRSVVERTETGLLVDPDNLQMVANSINRLLDNEVLYRKFKRNTQKASKLYQWENEEDKLMTIYNVVS